MLGVRWMEGRDARVNASESRKMMQRTRKRRLRRVDDRESSKMLQTRRAKAKTELCKRGKSRVKK